MAGRILKTSSPPPPKLPRKSLPSTWRPLRKGPADASAPSSSAPSQAPACCPGRWSTTTRQSGSPASAWSPVWLLLRWVRQAALAASGGGPAAVAGSGIAEPAAPFAGALPDGLSQRIAADFPVELRGLLQRAAVRLLDYQDAAYASLYLDRVAQVLKLEPRGRGAPQLTMVTARSLVLWMSFEDVIRVAQVKTRAGRSEQIRQEVRANPGELVRVSEFVKPRVEEICATLPAGIGRRMLASARASRLLSRFTGGRQISTSSIGGFALLRGIASLRRFRRATLRFQTEDERIDLWLQQIRALASADYALAVEIAECQNLVKGYGDTHERGWRSFSEICALAATLVGSGGGAQQVKRLREAALADDSGEKLGQAVAALKLSAAA